jgi:DNA replication protein DnaC
MRIITDEQIQINLEMYEEGIKQSLMEMLKREDKRTYLTLINFWNDFITIPQIFHSCWIYGEVGSGKTVHAAWRMLEWVKLKYLDSKPKRNIIFISCDKLLQEFKNSYSSGAEFTEKQLLDKYINADLLVIDDFLTEKNTAWNYKMLYMVINSRYKAIRPTIYTCNMSLGSLSTVLEDDRMPSRIEQDCGKNIFHFTGNSRRNNA